jgi:hypothetical protein
VFQSLKRDKGHSRHGSVPYEALLIADHCAQFQSLKRDKGHSREGKHDVGSSPNSVTQFQSLKRDKGHSRCCSMIVPAISRIFNSRFNPSSGIKAIHA